MADLDALLAQKAELDRRIDDARRQARSEAIAQVRALMAEYGLTVADLSAREAPRKARTTDKPRKVAVKFRDAASGNTWTGRGLQPKWLRAALATGRTLDEFRV